jgi:hypothetical protein
MPVPKTKGQGAAAAWLHERVHHAGDDCLIWPFSTNGTGYGRLGYEGRGYYAHRFMCDLAHGPAPDADHEVAHSCGNGMGGCVNPRHLAWKTRSENQLDRRRHGTHVTSTWGARGKLSSEEKMEILALKGKLPQRAIAARYGVHFETISRIHRTDPNRQLKHHAWWPDEDKALLAALANDEDPDEIAVKMGRSTHSIYGRIRRLQQKERSRSR